MFSKHTFLIMIYVITFVVFNGIAAGNLAVIKLKVVFAAKKKNVKVYNKVSNFVKDNSTVIVCVNLCGIFMSL